MKEAAPYEKEFCLLLRGRYKRDIPGGSGDTYGREFRRGKGGATDPTAATPIPQPPTSKMDRAVIERNAPLGQPAIRGRGGGGGFAIRRAAKKRTAAALLLRNAPVATGCNLR